MPLHVEQNKLRTGYIIISFFAIIYFMAPIVSILYFAYYSLAGNIINLVNGIITIVCFVLFAKRIFLTHQRIYYMWDGLYTQEDKKKIEKLVRFSPTYADKVYGKLPLPLIKTSRKGDITR